MNWYRNKTILITGATSGIGEALAVLLAPYQPTLLLVARREAELNRVADACQQLGAQTRCFISDLSNRAEVNALIKNLHAANTQIDMLINNAGMSQRALVMDSSEETERQLMELNYFTPVFLSKMLLPLYSKEIRIVVISSLSGLFGFPLRSTYAASKHALKGYFESWQVEQQDIQICMVYPGRIQSNISINALTGDGSKHGVMDNAQKQGIPAKDCAQQILKAAAKGKKRLLIGRKELILYWIYKFTPPLFFKIASTIKANG